MPLTAARLDATAFVNGRASPFVPCLFWSVCFFTISPTLAGLIPRAHL